MNTSSERNDPSITPITKPKDHFSIQNSALNKLPSDLDRFRETQYAVSGLKLFKVWIFFGVYIGIVAIILIFFFYFLLGNSLDQQRLYAVLNSVSKIMKAPPIADLYVTSKECPLDYNAMPLGEWPGTDHGCYYKKENTVVLGNCNQESQGIGVQSTAAVPIKTWNGYKFCVKRYSSMAIEYNEDCPYGFKKCGIYLCVPEKDKCPITFISWVPGTPPVNNSKTEVVLVDYENHNYITVERIPTREPLVEFTISYDGMPCLDINSVPFPGKVYPLLKLKPGCHYGQNFEAEMITSKLEQYFLEELPTYNSSIQQLALIDNYALNNTVYLIAQNRFKIRPDKNCSNPEQFFFLSRVTEKVDEITRVRTLFVITVLFGVIIIIFLSCDQRRVSFGLGSIDLTMQKKNGLFIFILCNLLFLITVCCLFIVNPKMDLIRSYRVSLKAYLGNNCFMNTFILEALNNFANGPPYQAELFFNLMLLIAGLSMIPILIITIEKCKGNSEENKFLIDYPDHEE